MKCPYCERDMEKGEVQIGDAFQALLKSGGPVLWVPQNDCKKFLPKKTVSLIGNAEGYYCEQCAKVVAIFDERGADFLQ